jgi:hypothetical protein
MAVEEITGDGDVAQGNGNHVTETLEDQHRRHQQLQRLQLNQREVHVQEEVRNLENCQFNSI